MQVFQPQPTRVGSRLSIVTGLVIGLLLIGLGAALGYLALATPFSQQFAPDPRANGVRVVLGAIGWTLLIAAPAITAVAGVAWLAGVYERASTFRTKPHPVTGLTRILGEDYAAATNVRLPDGRIVSEIIVGPHGIAVFEPLPPQTMTQEPGRSLGAAGRQGSLDPAREPARAGRPIGRSRPPLARRRGPRLRRAGVRGGHLDRERADPDIDLRRRDARAGAGLSQLAADPARVHRRAPGPGDRGPARRRLIRAGPPGRRGSARLRHRRRTPGHGATLRASRRPGRCGGADDPALDGAQSVAQGATAPVPVRPPRRPQLHARGGSRSRDHRRRGVPDRRGQGRLHPARREPDRPGRGRDRRRPLRRRARRDRGTWDSTARCRSS